MFRRIAIACFYVAGFSCLLAHAQVARAEDALDENYFGLKLVLGVGGEASAETTVGNVTASGDTDLDPSFGGAVEYMAPLHEYFVLGGMAEVASWQTDNGNDRNVLLDLDVVPQLRFPVTSMIELSLGVPVGFSLDFWGGDSVDSNLADADVSTGVGFNIGGLAGLRVSLVDGFGLLAEIGYQVHSFSHSAEATVLGATASQDFDVSLGQFVVNLGVFFH
jgi:hypothetical protein